MRSDYQDRLEQKLERAEELAEKNREKSAAHFDAANKIASVIPMGQPILVGHHSERGHRADLKRIDNNMRNGIETQKKAEYFERKTDRLEKQLAGKGPISSDDPEAVQRLKEKIAKAEAAQTIYKEVNKVLKKYIKAGAESQHEAIAEELRMSVEDVRKLLIPDFAGRIGIPDYEIRNNSANIRRLKERLSELEAVGDTTDSEQMIGDVRVIESMTDNRLQLFFPDKPDEATREKLKRNGFRWAGSLGCWQRHLNESARWAAKRVLGGV